MWTPKPAFLAALIAFAPADALRADAGGNAPALEIVTFRLVDGVDKEAFLTAAKGTEAMLRDRGALVRRTLSVDESGIWSDVIEWTSMAEALSAAEDVMADPSFAPFGAMIDPETVEMRHSTITWQME